MKVIFVGELTEYTTTAHRARGFEALGHELVRVPTFPPELPGVGAGPSLLERAAWRLGLPRDRTGANARLREAASEGADLVWVEKGVTIRPAILAAVKRALPDAPLVSYSDDAMTFRHNRSRLYARGLALYDAVFTPKRVDLDGLPHLGARRVLLVDNAYDPETHRPLPLTPGERSRWGADVAFVGTFEDERAAMLEALADAGVEVRIWGNGWSAWKGRHPRLRIEDRPVFHDDYARVVAASRINLCFLRRVNADTVTSRSVEIPAMGGFMLAERTTDHRRLFEEGEEAAYFAGAAELIEKTRWYLEHDEARAAVAAAGRRRCVDDGYSQQERVAEMLEMVGLPSRASGAEPTDRRDGP